MARKKKRLAPSPARRPEGVDALEAEGVAAFNRGDFGAAIVLFSKAFRLNEENPRVLFNLGTALQRVAEHQLAVRSFRAAIQLRPGDAATYNNLGLSLLELGQHEAAAESFRTAVGLSPSLFEAYGNLGNALRTAGLLQEAAEIYEQAMRMRPESSDIHRAHILTKVYDPAADNDALFALARDFEARHAHRGAPPTHQNAPDPHRRLRIGYLSSDFRDHPAGHNLAPLFFNHDSSRFETFLYAEVATRDFMTDAFTAAADHVYRTTNRSDAEIAGRIAEDQVDILVFLAGYLDANRSLVATRKPAPIQVSYHDVATSGLESVDYWMSDPYCTPVRGTERFTERVVRLPRLLVYRPIQGAPDVGPPPCLSNGFVTFGSMNNPAKLNEQVVALYAQVLQAVPGSRLLLKYTGTFDSAETRERFLDGFARSGVARERISFRYKREDRAEHLAHYRDVDIALDTFPFNGVTTTFEALWMGVPVVTLPGDRFIARAAASILRSIDFEAGVAAERGDYVRKAQALAGDPQRLAGLRGRLRETMLGSGLMDEERYARNIERTFRAMWRMWCSTRR